MAVGNETAGIAPAPLSFLQLPSEQSQAPQERAVARTGSTTGPSIAGQSRVDDAQAAGSSGAFFPRGSFVNISA